jgi:hypothetical protein
METKFNFKSAICTSIEQSERLLALGLKKETADMLIMSYSTENDIIALSWSESGGWTRDNSIPAWSLHRLIEMMPLDVIPEGGFDNCFTLIKNYPKGYSVEYDGFSYYHKENIYDTLIEGIEHLIKEGFFNKEYLV